VMLRRLIMVVGCGGVVLCAVELDIRCTCHVWTAPALQG
jgi:hypothetical protein